MVPRVSGPISGCSVSRFGLTAGRSIPRPLTLPSLSGSRPLRRLRHLRAASLWGFSFESPQGATSNAVKLSNKPRAILKRTHNSGAPSAHPVGCGISACFAGRLTHGQNTRPRHPAQWPVRATNRRRIRCGPYYTNVHLYAPFSSLLA